jgi:hypothetical protein
MVEAALSSCVLRPLRPFFPPCFVFVNGMQIVTSRMLDIQRTFVIGLGFTTPASRRPWRRTRGSESSPASCSGATPIAFSRGTGTDARPSLFHFDH